MTPPRRPLTVDDLWRLKRIGAHDATADGSLIVAAVTTYDMETNKSVSRLMRFTGTDDPGVPLTHADTHSAEPALDPAGRRVAFTRKDKDGHPQLALLSLDGGEAEVLTEMPLGMTDPRWFPDGERIAFLGWVLAEAPTIDGTRELAARRKEDPVQAHITEDRIYRFWDSWLTDGKVLHLFVLDLKTRALTDLIPDSTRWFDFMDPSGSYDISPDGAEIAFSADSSRPPHSPTNWDVFVVPAAGGTPRNITADNPADDVRPRYSPDGKHILYGMQRELDFYADKTRLVAYDRAEDAHRVLTEDWDRSADGWEFTGRGDEVLFLAEDHASVVVYRTGLAPGTPTEVHRGGSYSGLRPLADGSTLVNRSDLSHPPELFRLDAEGSAETRISAVNDSILDELQMGEVREIEFEGAHGATVQGFVVLPPGFDPGKKWPLLCLVHGGPHGMFGDQFHFRWNFQAFAAPGYVVVSPNFHGSTSWGQEFAACIQGDWAERPYLDTMAAVDHVIGQGYVDETRMAVGGGSYGGYLAAWIAGQTDRFSCVINHAGVSDTLSEYASDVTYGRGRAFGGEPWKNLEGIDRSNPIRFASGFKSPMLVIHGEKDYRVPVHQGLAIYNVYQAMGLPARLVHFPDENHWVLKPRNSQLWYREFHAWLERWIGAGLSGAGRRDA